MKTAPIELIEAACEAARLLAIHSNRIRGSNEKADVELNQKSLVAIHRIVESLDGVIPQTILYRSPKDAP
ncbi:hypothetical protein NXS98_14270 [Fontisphaera persica]|uniref:hypothetical protein n=1 Tax=Fontisphaera persica TaxID=2974023 RepID=UPI0024BFEA5B|nr:hypothetical protein [Fontisphaera persica]WCJ58874.1 hypothetical protein NXS98_14270 [Fontisphaera persica]